MKAKIFSNKGMKIFCETFNCRNPAEYFIGHPEGPLMLLRNICGECRESIMDALIEEDRQGLFERISRLEEQDEEKRLKETHDGREFPCPHCDEVFYSPAKLGGHVKSKHKKTFEVGSEA